MQPHTKPAHYLATTYDTKARFASYWQQAQLIQSSGATNFLDIGTGNGFLKDYLQRRNIKLTTVDADCELMPDICASITALPLQDKSFDAVSCFQVLEHLDFIYFAPALSELRRVSRGHAFISLPDVGLNLSICIRLDKLINISFRLPLHIVKTSLREDSEHKWEINRKGYPLRRIKRKSHLQGGELKAHLDSLKTRITDSLYWKIKSFTPAKNSKSNHNDVNWSTITSLKIGLTQTIIAIK